MYNVMIVDDEAIIRNSLRSLLERMANPLIGEICCCTSAEDALSACVRWQPDIVITDIVMGERNGIELIDELRQTMPGTRFLVISGYDDFQYARSAFMKGAIDYLLKPVLYPQFRKAIDRICAELDQGEILRLSGAFQQFVDAMRSGQGGEEVRAGIPGIDPSSLVALALLSFPTADGLELDRALSGAAFKPLLTRAAQGRRGNTVYLLAPDPLGFDRELVRLLEALPADIAPAIACETCIAAAASYSYYRLRRRLSRRLREGYGRIYEENTPAADSGMGAAEAAAALRALVESVQLGNVEHACARASECFAQTPGWDLEWLYRAFASMVRARAVEKGASAESGLPPFSALMTESDLAAAVRAALLDLARLDHTEYAGLMTQIQQYIEDNYGRRLTLSEVAEQFAVSYAHLSHVISKSMNLSFTDWLTAVRMRHARELLYQPTLSIQEIAGLCGYENQFTFTRAFKKYYSISPSGYRKVLDDTRIE